LGMAGKSSAEVEFSRRLLSICNDGIVAITDPVAMIALSYEISSVEPSSFVT
jgi:hypothetical protein